MSSESERDAAVSSESEDAPAAFAPDFRFDAADDDADSDDRQALRAQAQRRKANAAKALAPVAGPEGADEEAVPEALPAVDTAMAGGRKRKGAEREAGSEEEEGEERGERVKFAVEVRGSAGGERRTWEAMHLSRPLMRAIRDASYGAPTPVQAMAIPYIKEGRDVLASALTGSGKTAAFLLPVLERLLHRERREARTRVLVLSPTRELAVQTYDVLKRLSAHTTVTAAQAIGGLSVKQQEAAVQLRPDIVIGTPGRVVDLAENTRGFGLDAVEVLVLDEADRLLDLGFLDEITHIVRACPPHRQTLLFSATMTEQVKKLQVLAMRPDAVRVAVDDKFETALGLQQEFVRLKADDDKEAALLALATRSFTQRVIVFAAEKIRAHRLKQLLCLAGLAAVELHGNLTQAQRLASLDAFKTGAAEFLVATDVAARGLDVPGVRTVINHDLPAVLPAYVHRVGRTARAGASGCAVSLVTEPDRRLFKAVVKSCRAQGADASALKQRTVPAAVLAAWRAKIDAWAGELAALDAEERTERRLAESERDAQRATNLLQHSDEIKARPARAWIASKAQKAETKGPPPSQASPRSAERAKEAVMAQKRRLAGDADTSASRAGARKAKKERRGGGARPAQRDERRKRPRGPKQRSAFDAEA